MSSKQLPRPRFRVGGSSEQIPRARHGTAGPAAPAIETVPCCAIILSARWRARRWYFQFFFYTMGGRRWASMICIMDTAHGEHHHLQHDVGLDSSRMERREQKSPSAHRRRHRHAGPIDHDHRLGRLFEKPLKGFFGECECVGDKLDGHPAFGHARSKCFGLEVSVCQSK